MCVILFFFFKQKTAYEMRISDWSSDVCSSDLLRTVPHNSIHRPAARYPLIVKTKGIINTHTENYNGVTFFTRHKLSNNSDNISQIGRASCRERVCQYV